ncbi:Denitrification regulatory protein NirQ [Paraconexibacter sp. AEG42_29]|uniref:Denitrification regulatory protein NirQ n=1 Tax=Paraconexibacter sp. AEG42_29 TaxID=2997339 RepID=A0AAU7APZ0_9ACTN
MTDAVKLEAPFYAATSDEIDVFAAAWRQQLAVMLKGPTGCGKTRLVEHMAARLDVPLMTVSCHEDMTASDLLGRFVLTGGDTEWVDGPLTQAVRLGGICYLDEVVEARQDAVVAVHSLTDHRRTMTLERLGGETIQAAPGFMLVVSYNPGYQSVLKDLKVSTRQRMVGLDLTYPPADTERLIVSRESGLDDRRLDDLIRLGQALRRGKDAGLREVASTRTLIAAARLMQEGLGFRRAATAAIAAPLTDDEALTAQLITVIDAYDSSSEHS